MCSFGWAFSSLFSLRVENVDTFVRKANNQLTPLRSGFADDVYKGFDIWGNVLSLRVFS